MGLANLAVRGPAERAFCKELETIAISAGARHNRAIDPFLDSFRSWVR